MTGFKPNQLPHKLNEQTTNANNGIPIMNTPENNNTPGPQPSASTSRGDEIVAALASQLGVEALSAEVIEKINTWARDNPVYFGHRTNMFYVECSKSDETKSDDEARIMALDWSNFDAVLRSQYPETKIWLTKEKDGESLIPAIKAAIIRQKFIDDAGCLAGYRQGMHTLPSGRRYLALQSQRCMKPAPGDYQPVYEVLEGLFGADTKELLAVLSWIKIAVTDLAVAVEHGAWDKRIRPRQALIIIGPPGAGKSLFAELLKHMFGGSMADPSSYFEGSTNFNADIMASALLLADDNVESRNPAARRRLGQSLKQFLVVSEKRSHEKYMNAFSAPSFHATVFLGNSESLSALPIIDASMRDKVILVQAKNSELVSRMRTVEERAEWNASMISALPAFIDFLVNHFEIPSDMRDSRFGLAGLVDDQLLVEINDDEVLEDLYAIVMKCLVRDLLHPHGVDHSLVNGISGGHYGKICPKTKAWLGRASDFERYVKFVAGDLLNLASIFKFNSSSGEILTKLADKHSAVKKLGMSQGRSRWEIKIVPADAAHIENASEPGEIVNPRRINRDRETL